MNILVWPVIQVFVGRRAAAEHFDKSDADYMFFFEDDMTVNPPDLKGQVCRNGFRKYIQPL